MRKRTFSMCLMLMLSALLCLPGEAGARSIHVGSITSHPNREIKKFLPLVTFLEKALRTAGVDGVSTVITAGVKEMAAAMRLGKVDLQIDNAFLVLPVSEMAGSRIQLRRWKRGAAEYRSVIFTRKDSGIRRLEDLRGTMLALERVNSLTGYLLPKFYLLQKSFEMIPAGDATPTVGPKSVGYLLLDNEENIMAWLLRGKVNAGAMSEESYLPEARGDADKLFVIDKTFAVPRHLVSFRKDLPQELAHRIKQTLLEMDRCEAGRKALQEFEETLKFDEVTDRIMTPLERVRPFLQAELDY